MHPTEVEDRAERRGGRGAGGVAYRGEDDRELAVAEAVAGEEDGVDGGEAVAAEEGGAGGGHGGGQLRVAGSRPHPFV